MKKIWKNWKKYNKNIKLIQWKKTIELIFFKLNEKIKSIKSNVFKWKKSFLIWKKLKKNWI